MNFDLLTQKNLDKFKTLYPNDKKLQALSLNLLIDYSRGKNQDGSSAQFLARQPGIIPGASLAISDCQIAIAGVTIDCILVIAGAVGIHGKIPSSAIEEVAKIIEPEISEIEKIASILADVGASKWDKAKAIFDIGKLIYSGGMLEAIYKAIVNGLTWWDMALYGVIGLAELTAVFLTDGAALAAIIVAEMAQIGFVVSDSVKAANACC